MFLGSSEMNAKKKKRKGQTKAPSFESRCETEVGNSIIKLNKSLAETIKQYEKDRKKKNKKILDESDKILSCKDRND